MIARRRIISIDLGKTTFHLVALGEHGQMVVRKKLSRKQLLAFTANLKPVVTYHGTLCLTSLKDGCQNVHDARQRFWGICVHFLAAGEVWSRFHIFGLYGRSAQEGWECCGKPRTCR